MADPPSRDFAPWFIEFFALACAFGCIDSLREHSPYAQCVSFAVASLILAVVGFKWPWIKNRAVALAKSPHLIRRALAENVELKRQLSERAVILSPTQNDLVKPQHNVQCVGFKVIADDEFPLSVATLCFQNVPTMGKLMGKFEYPRLRVIYYANSTGQEIADMSPLQWYGTENGPNEITAEVSYAEIASFLTLANVWRLFEVNEPPGDFDDWHKLRHMEVPSGEYRIKAVLSGSYGLNIPPITGILILAEDGTASFHRTTD